MCNGNIVNIIAKEHIQRHLLSQTHRLMDYIFIKIASVMKLGEKPYRRQALQFLPTRRKKPYTILSDHLEKTHPTTWEISVGLHEMQMT